MIEVLSPAGNITALKSAVANCADAVYLGLEQFNARLKADNFSTHNIKEWVEFCHLYNVKVYVTLNTLIKQKELSKLDDMLIACENAGVDAIIVTDFAVASKAKTLCPSVALHASTQMGVHNYLGAKLLEELGFSRVVLARECRLEDIKQIKSKTNLEIEYFVHGAMCVSFSGSCLLSSIATGNSGNRGLCLQPCRKEYSESLTGSNGYLISPKDQCLVENIKDLINNGVDSLKIEGRLKSAEYVGLITSKYRKAVDYLCGDKPNCNYDDNKNLNVEKITKNITSEKVVANINNKEVTKNINLIDNEDISQMKRVFNRGGFSKGYAFTPKNQMLYTLTQNHIGERIGQVTGCIKSKDYYKIEITSDFDLQNGDGIKIFRNDREVGGFEVSIIEKNKNKYKLYSRQLFSVGDCVHITLDNSLREKYTPSKMPKINLNINCDICQNSVRIITSYKNINIEYEENVNFEIAKNTPTSKEEIKTQLGKTGESEFEFLQLVVNISGNLFIPKSVINRIRRDFVEFVKRKISAINTPPKVKFKPTEKSNICKMLDENFEKISSKNSDILIMDKIDFECLKVKSSTKIVLNYNNFDKSILKYGDFYNNLYIKLPKIAFEADLEKILKTLEDVPNSVGIYADNLYAYYLAIVNNRPVIGGLGLNIFNSVAAEFLRLKSFVVSSELSKSEIEEMNLECAVFTFGYLPVMCFCHCPIAHFTGCSCADCKYKEYDLTDKYGKYKVRRVKVVNCYFEMLNSSCHYIEKEQLSKGEYVCIDLTGFEKTSKMANSCEFANKYLNNSCIILNNSIKLTKGHYLRGVK